jgi:hypothetical protein
MRKNQSVAHVRRRRVMRAVTASVTALAALLLLVASLAWSYQPAAAQGNGAGTLTLNTVPEFSVCVALPGVVPQPGLTNTIVSSANGGEIRLRATVEDYFDGTTIDATQWITGASNPASYPTEAPIVGSGVLTLYGSYLRSQTVFTSTRSPRFFDARVQFVGGGLPTPTNGDIGFYRALPPLLVPPGDESSIRLFISQPFNSTNNRLMYVRSRDGTSVPMIDSLVDNWTDDEATQRIGLSVFRNYRIDWGLTETWYSIDGSTIITAGAGDNPLPHTGVTTRTTYVFLYNQDPEAQSPDPLLIDWVRAGQYPTQGDYVSCAQDAGQIVNWSQATVTATVPATTGAQLATRTSVDGVTWSPWANAAGSVISGTATLTPASPSGRYLQYRLTLTSSDPLNSPEVGALTFSHFGPASLVVAPVATTLDPAASQQFTATVRDLSNTVIADAPVTWTSGSAGVIDGNGLFTAGLPAGVFTGAVRATTSNNISNTATVTVRDLPPVANAGGPYTGLEAQAVSLAASASDPNGGPIIAYDWDLDNDGQFDDATGATASASWGDEGVYTIGVRATDSSNLTGTATTTVTISNVTPQLTAVTNNGPVRRSQPVTVTVIASDVPGDLLRYSFDWNSDGDFDIVDQASNQAATAFANTGLYTVTVGVSDGDGGVVTGTTTVTVTPQILSVTAANNGPVRRAQPVTVTVTAGQELTDTLAYSFDWNNDGFYEIENQLSNSAVISYPTTGSKTVRVRVTDPDGGVVTGTTTVTVTPQILSVTAANNGPVRRAQPATVTVTAGQELTDTLAYSFDWNNDGFYEIENQLSNSAVISYPTTGSKTVRVRVTDPDGGMATNTTTVSVTPQTLSVTAANNGPVRRAQPATVTVTAGQELTDTLAYSFDWNNDGLYEIENQLSNSAVISYPTTGSKTVRVRVTDPDGGVATDTTTVVVTPQVLAITAVTNDGPVRRTQPVTVIVTATQELTDTFAYSFDWNNDGFYEIENQLSNSAVISYPTTGSKTVRVRVTDPDGGVATNTTTVSVTPQILSVTAANNGPVRRAQPATVTVTAGQELTDTLAYSFDWNNDGLYEIENQLSNSAVISYPTTGSKTVRVRVTDPDGGVATNTTTVVVTPQVLAITAVTNDGPVRRTQPVTVIVTATQELTDTFAYSFDWNDDGFYEIQNQVSNSAVISYPTTGNKTVRVRVTDPDGGGVIGTTTISVTPANSERDGGEQRAGAPRATGDGDGDGGSGVERRSALRLRLEQ